VTRHVARVMEQKINIIMFEKCKAKGTCVKPKHRWVANIKMDLRI
jgi:hypothetical protein